MTYVRYFNLQKTNRKLMYLTINFDRLLIQTLEDLILWFEEEFDLIFQSKENLSDQDINLGILIIENFVEVLKANPDNRLLDLLVSSLSNIRRKYPDFF